MKRCLVYVSVLAFVMFLSIEAAHTSDWEAEGYDCNDWVGVSLGYGGEAVHVGTFNYTWKHAGVGTSLAE